MKKLVLGLIITAVVSGNILGGDLKSLNIEGLISKQVECENGSTGFTVEIIKAERAHKYVAYNSCSGEDLEEKDIIGKECNDKNDLTINDAYDSEGKCGGTSIVGTSCDDEDNTTYDDKYNTSGVCVGTYGGVLTQKLTSRTYQSLPSNFGTRDFSIKFSLTLNNTTGDWPVVMASGGPGMPVGKNEIMVGQYHYPGKIYFKSNPSGAIKYLGMTNALTGTHTYEYKRVGSTLYVYVDGILKTTSGINYAVNFNSTGTNASNSTLLFGSMSGSLNNLTLTGGTY